MRPWRSALIAALTSSALSSPCGPAIAQTAPVAAAAVQPADSRTGIDVTGAGTPIVQIAPADLAGTSHNVFTSLSAGPEGLIFNNSPQAGQSQIGGLLLANPNLARRAGAQLILNEVTGDVRTTLAGPIEVFGQKAALVIANPIGLTCDGCGFINTDRVSLAAARLNFAASGAFAGFDTAAGDVTLAGQGLLAGNVDYVDIIAAATHVNAKLHARDLVIAAGGRFDYAQRSAEAATGAGSGAGVAIDSSLLGGMYANRIRLIGTGHGVGINLAGTVAALDGSLTISSDGRLAVGQAWSSGAMALSSTGDALVLSGPVYAGGGLALAGRTIVQAGGFAGAAGDVALAADAGVELSGAGLFAGLDGDGNPSGAGSLSVAASGKVAVGSATLASGGALRLTAAALEQGPDGQIAGQDVTLATTGGQALSGAVLSRGALAVSGDRLDLAGRLAANGAIDLAASTLSLVGTAAGNGPVAIRAASLEIAGSVHSASPVTLEGDVLRLAGQAVAGSGLRATAAAAMDISGTLSAGGDLSLAATDLSAAADSRILAGEGLSIITTGRIDHAGTISGSNVVVQADRLIHRGTTRAAGNLTLTATTDLTQAGVAQAERSLDLAGANVSLSGQALGALAGAAGDALTIRAGRLDGLASADLQSGGGLAIIASDSATLRGSLVGIGQIAISAGTGLLLDASLSGHSGVDLSAGDGLAVSGSISGAGRVALSALSLVNSGTVRGSGEVALRATLGLSSGGALLAGGSLSLAAADVALWGTATSNGLLSVTAPRLTVSGRASGLAGVKISVGDLAIDSGGALQSGTDFVAGFAGFANAGVITAAQAVQLSSTGGFDSSGVINAGTSLSLRADHDLALAGQIQSGGDLALEAGGSAILAGRIMAGGKARVRSDGLQASGTLGSAADLAITTGRTAAFAPAAVTYAAGGVEIEAGTLSQIGRLQSDKDLRLAVLGGLELGGSVQALGDASLEAGGAAQLAGTLVSGGALTLTAQGLDLTGRMAAGRSASLVATTSDLRLTGTLQAGGDVRANAAGALTIAPAGPLSLAPDGAWLTASGAVSLIAQSARIDGDVTAHGNVTALIAQHLGVNGEVWSDGALGLRAGSLQVGDALDSTARIAAARIAAAGRVDLAADGFITNTGTIASTGGDVLASLTGSFATVGRMSAATSLAITTRADLRAAGTISADTVDLSAGDLSLAGTLVGQDGVAIAAGTLSVDAPGAVQSGGALSLTSAGRLAIAGGVLALGDLGLTAQGPLDLLGQARVQAGQALTGRAGGTITADAATALSSGQALMLSGESLILAGSLASNADLLLTSQSGLSLAGTQTALTDARLAAAGTLSLRGALAVGGRLRLDGAAASLQGRLSAVGEMTVATGALALGGAVTSSASLRVDVTGDVAMAAGQWAGPGEAPGWGASLSAAGAITLNSGGNIALMGQIGAGGALHVAAAGNLATGDLLASNAALVLSGSDLTLDGAVSAGASLSLTAAGRLSGRGTLGAGWYRPADAAAAGGGATIAAASIAYGGDLTVNGDLAATAAGPLALTGVVNVAGSVRLRATVSAGQPDLVLGAVTADGDIALVSAADASLLGPLSARGNLGLTAASVLAQGAVTVGGSASLSATVGDIVVARTLSAVGRLDLAAHNDLLVRGDVVANGDIAATAGRAARVEATLAGGGAITFGSGAGLTLSAAGALLAGGDAARPAQMAITAEGLDNAGRISATGGLRAELAGALINRSGAQLLGGGSLDIAAGTVSTERGSLLAGNGTVRLDISGAVRVDGHLGAQRDLTIAAGSLTVIGAQAAAGGVGGVQAGAALSLTSRAGSLSAMAGSAILSGGRLSVASANDLSLAGKASANGAVSLAAAGRLATSGELAAQGNLTLQAATLDLGGTLAGQADLSAFAGNTGAGKGALTVTGTVSAQGDIALIGGATTIGGAAALASGKALSLTTATLASTGQLAGQTGLTVASSGDAALGGVVRTGAVDNAGQVAIPASLAIAAAGTLALRGDLSSTAGLSLTAGTALSVSGAATSLGAVQLAGDRIEVAGTIKANGLIGLAADGDVALAGNLLGLGGIAARVKGDLALSGQLGTNAAVSFDAAGALVQTATGEIAALGDVSLAGRQVDLAGSAASNGTLVLTSAGSAAIGQGARLSARAVTLTAAGDATLGGTLAAAVSLSATVAGQLEVTANGLLQAGTAAPDGTITAIGAMALTAGGITNRGAITSTGSTRLISPLFANIGTFAVGDDMAFSAETLNLGGTFASRGAITATATGGPLTLTGRLEGQSVILKASGGDLSLGATARIAAFGSGAAGLASLTSDRSIVAAGRIEANNDIAIDAGQSLAIGQDQGGTAALTTLGRALLSAGDGMASLGTIRAAGDIRIAADSLSINDIASDGTLSLASIGALRLGGATYGAAISARSSQGAISLTAGATVQSLGAVALEAAGDLAHHGKIVAGSKAPGSGGGAVTLTAGGVLNFDGGIVSHNDAVTLGARSITLAGSLAHGGGVYAAGTLRLNTPTLAIGAGGEVVGNAGVTFAGSSLDLGAGSLLQSNRAIDFVLGSNTSPGRYASAGNLVALGDLRLTVRGGAITNSAGGGIYAGGSGAGAGGGSIRLSGDRFDSAGTVVATRSTSGHGGDLTLDVASNVAVSGLVHADKALKFKSADLALGRGAVVESGTTAFIDARAITLDAGAAVQSSGTLDLLGAALTSAGSILSGGNATLQTGGIMQSTGSLQAAGSLALTSGGALSLGGTTTSVAGLTVNGASLDLGGTVQAWNNITADLGTLRLTARTGSIVASGRLISSGALTAAASGTFSTTATAAAVAGGALTLTADRAILAAGSSIGSHADLAVTTRTGFASGGKIVADGRIGVADGTRIALEAGSVVSAGVTQAAPAVSAATVTLDGPSVVARGVIDATGGLALIANALDLSGRASVNGDITLSRRAGGALPTVAVSGHASSYLGNIALGAIGGLDLGGCLVAAGGSVSLTSPITTIRAGGKLAGGTDVTITMVPTAVGSAGALGIDGSVLAGRDVTLDGGVLNLAASGTIQAGRDLAFATLESRLGHAAISINGISYDYAGKPVSATIGGQLLAGNDLTLMMPGAALFTETSEARAGRDLDLVAGQALVATQVAGSRLGMVAGRDLAIESFSGPGALAASDLGTNGLVLDGSIQAGRDLTIAVAGTVSSTASSQLVAGQELRISGAALGLSGFNSGNALIQLEARGGLPADAVSTLASGEAILAGASASYGRITLAAHSATIADTGSITTHSGAAAAAVLRDSGALASIALTTTGTLTNNGAIWSDKAVLLHSAAGDVVNDARGANGGITAASIVVQADGGAFRNRAGAFKAENAQLFLATDFVNTGSFAPSGNYWISAANIRNTGLLGAGGNLRLDAAGDLYNAGTIYAGKGLTLNLGGTLTNDYVGDDHGNGAHGLILAQGDIAIAAHDVLNQSATIQSLGGSIDIALTGGTLANTIKSLKLSEVLGTGVSSQLFPVTGGTVGRFATRSVKSSDCGTMIDSYWLVQCSGPLKTGDRISFVRVVGIGAGGVESESYTYIAGTPNDTRAEVATGTATISAAQNLTIRAGAGAVTNRNSALLAGGNVSIETTALVTNQADLLIRNTNSGGTRSVTNDVIPGAPTIIQAGGTVFIPAGRLDNQSLNLVGADSYSGLQVVQNAAPGAPGQAAPATGSMGNLAGRGAAGPTGAGVSGPTVAGGAAASTGAQAAGPAGGAKVALVRGGAGGLIDAPATAPGGGGALETVKGSTGISGAIGAVASLDAAAAQSAAPVQDGGEARLADARPLQGGPAAGAAGKAATATAGWAVGAAEAPLATAIGAVAGAGAVTGGVVDTPEAVRLGVPGLGAPAAVEAAATIDAGVSAPALAEATSGPAPLAAGLVPGGTGNGLPGLSVQPFGDVLRDFLRGFNLGGKAPALFTYSANPNSAYLFTTTAALANEAILYDSQWFFDRVAPDRATTFTRLGDGFFDALLVSREVQAATGQAQLGAYGSALDQYQGLLKNAGAAQGRLGLSLGVALTADQVAALTSPILWYVAADTGAGQVLVPVLYLAADDAKTIANGALIAGQNVVVAARDGITNSGTIRAAQVVSLAANGGDLVNATGGTIAGGAVVASAARDILLQGGSTLAASGRGGLADAAGASAASGIVSLRAGRDIATGTIKSTQVAIGHIEAGRNWAIDYKQAETVTGAAIAATGAVSLAADRNIALNAATLSASGAATLTAGQDVTIAAAEATTRSHAASAGSRGALNSATSFTTTAIGTTITAAGPIAITALGGRLAITGATLKTTAADNGDIALSGATGVTLSAAQNTGTLQRFDQTGKKSWVATTETSLTHQLASVDAAGALRIATPGALSVNGGSLVSGQALTVDAGRVAVSGVIDRATSDVTTWSRKSGLLASTTTTTHTVTSDERVVGSTLSGDSLTIRTPGAVEVRGSSLVATHDVAIAAGGPVTLGTLAEIDSTSQSVSVQKRGITLGGGGMFIGVAKTANTLDNTSVTQVGSLVGSQLGDVAIVSRDALQITGSQVVAPGDPASGSGGALLLQGRSIDIANALDLTDTTRTAKSSSFGVSIGLSSQAVQSATNLVAASKIATSSGNARVQAVAGAAAGMAAVNTFNAVKDLASGDLSKQVTASIGIGWSKSSSRDVSHQESAVAGVVSGRNVTLVATGEAGGQGGVGGPAGTITVTGSNLAATQDLTLAANGAITLAAAQERDSQSGTAKSAGVSLSVSTKADITAGFNASKGNYTGADLRNVETALTAGGTTRIATPGALTIDGSTVAGQRVEAGVGSLTIASRQDTSTYHSATRSTGVSVSYNFASGRVGISGSFASGKQDGDFASVAEQAGITAGAGGFAVSVAGHSDLKGGVIDSTADPARNSFATGTLATSDIQNREAWSASQLALSDGVNFATGGKSADGKAAPAGTPADRQGTASPKGATPLPGVRVANGVSASAGLPLALNDNGGQQGTTRSAIAAGALTITSGDAASLAAARALSRDAAGANVGALGQQFTEAKRGEVAQGFAAAQILAAETQAFFARKAEQQQAKELTAQARRHEQADGLKRDDEDHLVLDSAKQTRPLTNAERAALPDQIRTLTADAAKLGKDWSATSPARLVATALSGAAGSGVTGSVGSLVQGAAVNVLQGLTVRQVKTIADSLQQGDPTNPQPTASSETVRAALQAVTACAGGSAGSIGGGTGPCGSAALGAASSVVVNYLLTDFGNPVLKDRNGNGTLDPEERPSLADQQARTTLASTVAAAIAQGAGLTAGAAANAAAIETENNALQLPDGRLVQLPPPVQTPYGLATLAGKDAEFKALLDKAALDPRFGGDVNKLVDAYYRYATCLTAPQGECQTQSDPLLDAVAAVYSAEVEFIKAQDAADDKACNGSSPLICGIQRSNAFFRSPDGVRLAGAMDMINGAVGLAGSGIGAAAGATSCVETAGGGCMAAVVGVAGGAASADQIATGWKKLTAGTPQQTAGAKLIAEALNVSPQTGELIYGGATLGLGVAAGHLGNVASAERAAAELPAISTTPPRIMAGIELNPKLPDPVAALDYAPKLLTGGTELNQLSHLNGFREELRLANKVADLPGETVVYYGDRVNSPGADVISVNANGTVTLWDSKFLSDSRYIKSSKTFELDKETLKRSLDYAIKYIEKADLSNDIKNKALGNIDEKYFNLITSGSGNAKNSIIIRICSFVICKD